LAPQLRRPEPIFQRLWWLVAARVLQAVGAALLTPASLSIVLVVFPQERCAVVVSL
jgi:MFS family permease